MINKAEHRTILITGCVLLIITIITVMLKVLYSLIKLMSSTLPEMLDIIENNMTPNQIYWAFLVMLGISIYIADVFMSFGIKGLSFLWGYIKSVKGEDR